MNNMKNINSFDDLAISGAPPLFSKPKVVGYPRIGDRQRFHEIVDDILDRRWLTNNGTYLQELTGRLQAFLGVKHVIPICNATVGLELATKVLGLSGEVLVPSFTFIATAHILHWLGIKPVFVDVDPVTHCIDPEKTEALITEKTTGILGVHLWGNPCDTVALQALADKHGLKLFYDAAHAFGCSLPDGRMIGNFGSCEVFSFHATKIFNTLEGGAITTNDDALAELLRKSINFGFAGEGNVACAGTNAKLNEVSAAMGLVNLEAFPGFVSECEGNYKIYREVIAEIEGIELMSLQEDHANYHYIVANIDAERYGMTRDELYGILLRENVIAQRYFYPGCHEAEPYRTLYPDTSKNLPVTVDLCKRVMVLPNHGMNESNVQALGRLLEVCRRRPI